MPNDAVLDGAPGHAARTEAGVNERARDMLCQGDRSYYAGAFYGGTPIGDKKGNRPLPEGQGLGPSPFVRTRGGNR